MSDAGSLLLIYSSNAKGAAPRKPLRQETPRKILNRRSQRSRRGKHPHFLHEYTTHQAVWNVAAVGCGLTSSLSILLIWRALVGLGQGCYETLLPGWLGDALKPGWRSLVFGIIQSTAPVGAAIGFVVGSYLSAQLNWHYAFILTGAPGILLAIAFMFSREPQRGQSEEDKRVYAVPTLSETTRALLSPLFLIFLVGKMAFTTGLSGIATLGPSFFHRAYGLSNTEAPGFFASGWVSVGLIGVLLGGWIGGVWRRRNLFAYPLIVTMGCAITAPALFAAFLRQNQSASQVFILLEIFFTCLCLGPVNALLIETVPVAQRSAASAVTVICWRSMVAIFGWCIICLSLAKNQMTSRRNGCENSSGKLPGCRPNPLRC